MKKIFLIFVLISITSCGYSPIYSSKNFLFEIGEINYERNNINNQLVRSLELISNKNAKKTLNINLSSKKEKTVISKTKTGDAELFELIISANIKISDKEKTFLGRQRYNNNDNKFQLKEYEVEIEKQIIDEIIEDILTYLSQF